MNLFTVLIEHKPRNFCCNCKLTATSEKEAIRLTKERMVQAFRDFFKKNNVDYSEDFWKDCVITTKQETEPTIINFVWDRIDDKDYVHLMMEQVKVQSNPFNPIGFP